MATKYGGPYRTKGKNDLNLQGVCDPDYKKYGIWEHLKNHLDIFQTHFGALLSYEVPTVNVLTTRLYHLFKYKLTVSIFT